jgi:hypothetical protein
MQMKYFLHVLVMGMLLSLHSFSQSVIISYKTGLPDNGCNLFYVANPITINGYQHYPVAGGVGFHQTQEAIYLKGQSGNSIATMLGTAYAIKYPFKEGYTYNIKVQSWQLDLPSTGFVNLSFSMIDQLPDPNKTRPDLCGPVDEDKWFDLANTVLNQIPLDTNKKTNRDVGTFLMDQNHNYLTVVAWMNPSGTLNLKSGYIRQITITETPPTYTLAPTSISKVCGTGLSQTFTITDVHNSGKVSSYTWDLTLDNNGWLYNGAPAPRFITTTTPSLTLAANDCAVPTNVTATAARPNGNFATNTTAVTTTNPVTLSGPSQTCGGTSTYSVNNLTCGDVTWSLSPGAIGTLSTTTGPTTSLTTPAQNQGLTIYANIATTCLPKTLSQSVSVLTKPKDIEVDGEPVCQDGSIVQVSTFYADPGADSYNWSSRNGSGPIRDLPYHTAEIRNKYGLGAHTIYVYAVNFCGRSNVASYQFTINRCNFATASEQENGSVAVSPNPASNVVVVTTNTTSPGIKKLQEKHDIREVRIIDKTGKLLRKQSFPAGTTTATINVEDFKPDIYILQIGNGKTFETRKIKISR